ncbi:YpmS family protein [Thalassorhabdus alkalitolerans]|uniref:YpmS family protein n=1 Tax=Thalassorhabdus alkalitolerans TaxID=2282697 RepID=A0ABW0YN39_9BACI
MKNIWMIAFFLLLSVNIIVIIGGVAAINHYLPETEDSKELPERTVEEPGEPVFTLTTTKEQLNYFLYEELEDEEFSVEAAEDRLILESSIELLGRSIELEMNFAPEVQENGDLILREDGLRLGILQLPGSEALQVLTSQADLPEWAEIYPEERAIYISLSEIEINDEYVPAIREIDLLENNIEIDILRIQE